MCKKQQAAAGAELKKQQKYQEICSGVDFIPVAIETTGVWGQQAMEIVSEIGHKLAEVNHDPRSVCLFLRQRIPVAVQRGNAACINGTLRANCI